MQKYWTYKKSNCFSQKLKLNNLITTIKSLKIIQSKSLSHRVAYNLNHMQQLVNK